MPTVTIEWTPEEREKLNAKGDALGCAKCPRCGDSARWKPFHHTTYEEGVVMLANAHDYKKKEPIQIKGHKSVIVLCEECFLEAPKEDRRRYYKEAMERRETKARSVKRLRGERGEMVECKLDRARFDHEMSIVLAEREAILAAVEQEG